MSGGRLSLVRAMGMERFIRRENVKHYRELLKTVKDERERELLLKLLAEEQQKQKDANDPLDED